MRQFGWSALALLLAPAVLVAQQTRVRADLEARGLPAALAAEVGAIADSAAARSLPVEPLEDKAIEGWTKRVPAPRIVAAVRQLTIQLDAAAAAVEEAGLSSPAGTVVSAAAEALARGISQENVHALVQAAPTPEAAAPGLTVAAALAAQGLSASAATDAVVQAFGRGGSVAQVLDLPSVANLLIGQGVPASEVARRLTAEGVLAPPGRPAAAGGKPPAVPPGLSPNPPGKRTGKP